MPLYTLPGAPAAGQFGHDTAHVAIHQLLELGGADVFCANSSGDAALIQTAIDNSAAGDVIRVHGPASITATIRLRDDRDYVFDSRGGAALTQAAGANLDAVVACNTWWNNSTSTNSGITIAGLSIDGNEPNQTGGAGHGLVLRCYDTIVTRLRIRSTRGDGLRISNEARDGTTLLAGTSVNTQVDRFFIEEPGGAGVRCLDGGNALTDWTLKDGWISSPVTHAVLLDNTAGWCVENIHAYAVQQNAFDLKRCFGSRIRGNYVEDFGLQGSATTYYGIRAAIQGDASSVITGNAVHHFGALAGGMTAAQYIRVEGNYDTPVVSVTGNTVRGSGDARETGLSYAVGSATVMQIASTGNRVFNIGGTARSVGGGVTLDAGL